MDEESVKPCIQDRFWAFLGTKEDQLIFLSFILITIIVVLFSYVPPLKQYWDSFYPAVMATFLGIFLGFTLDRILVRGQRKDEAKNLLRGIRNELIYIKSRIYPKTGGVFLTYQPEWDSAISNGRLQLLKNEERKLLSIIYNEIKYIQYEAMRVRDASEDHNRTQYDEKDFLKKRVNKLHMRYRRLGQKLTDNIEEILKTDFFTKVSNNEKPP